jgi:iron complex transport system ATP-binding protein
MSQGRIAAAGTPGELFDDDLLSRVFGCPIRANRTPAPDIPFVLPHAHAAPANPP